MNNKGQTLVLFLILFPIFLILFLTFYQVGIMTLDKKKFETSIQDAIKYGLNNMDDLSLNEQIIEIITTENINLKPENIKIDTDNEEITITVKKKYLISFITSDNLEISYTGKIILDKIEIVKDRG